MPIKIAKELTELYERVFNKGRVPKTAVLVAGSVLIAIAVSVQAVVFWKRRRKVKPDDFIRGVAILPQGGIQVLDTIPRPKILADDEVLVCVKAASVDPLDLRLSLGYRHSFFRYLNYFSKCHRRGLPTVLGRQCSGIVEDFGSQVDFLMKGDQVWLYSFHWQPGVLAEYVAVKSKQVTKKPFNISFELAASLPYTAMVTWEALVKSGCTGPSNTKGKRILVHAGNSACGILAIQLVKNWGGHVTTTVPTIGLPLVRYLRADDVIVYSVTNFEEELSKREKFDVVFNTIGLLLHESCLKVCAPGGKIITLVTPPLAADAYGFVLGSFVSLASYIRALTMKVTHGITSSFSCGNFTFDKAILEELKDMVENGKVEVIVEDVYEMENAVQAFQHVAENTLIGSTVIRLSNC